MIQTIWDKVETPKEINVLEYIKLYYEETFRLKTDMFTLETKLTETGIDSLEAFNLLYELENVYGIRYSEKFTPITLSELVLETERLINAK